VDTRIVIPLSVVWAKRPRFALPRAARSTNSFRKDTDWVPVGGEALQPAEGFLSWRKFSSKWTFLLKDLEGQRPYFLRTWALKRFRARALDAGAQRSFGGTGRDLPRHVEHRHCVKALGNPDHDPLLQKNLKELESSILTAVKEGLEIQPCVSPSGTPPSRYWRCGIGLRTDHTRYAATRWILDREVKIGAIGGFKKYDTDPSAAGLLS